LIQVERDIDLFEYDDGINVVSGEVIGTTSSVVGGIGWNSTDNFDVLIGATYIDGTLDLSESLSQQFQQILQVTLDEIEVEQTGAIANVNWDSLDDASFPRRGWKLAAVLSRTRDRVLGVEDFSTQVDIEYNGVVSYARHTLRGQLRYQSTLNDDPLSLLGGFDLGGFLNLSGTPQDSIYGQHVRFASLVYTYELAANDFGAITLPLYLGVSAETGNAWDDEDNIDYHDLLASGSLFVGWDSPIGPAYFAYGQSEAGENSLYVFLGIVF